MKAIHEDGEKTRGASPIHCVEWIKHVDVEVNCANDDMEAEEFVQTFWMCPAVAIR